LGNRKPKKTRLGEQTLGDFENLPALGSGKKSKPGDFNGYASPYTICSKSQLFGFIYGAPSALKMHKLISTI
jgi:hypothetical protein